MNCCYQEKQTGLTSYSVCVCSVAQSCPTLYDPVTVAHQDPLSMELSRQEYWSGLPLPPPGDLPDPGIKLVSPALEGRFFTAEPLGKPKIQTYVSI